MTPEERDALLAKPLNAVLAVPRDVGGPQLTVLWFHWDGQAFYLSTTRSRSKYANITRHPDISLLVDDPAAHKWVAAYGRAEIVEDNREHIMALTRPIMERYAPQRVARMAETMEPDRIVIVLRPERIVTREP